MEKSKNNWLKTQTRRRLIMKNSYIINYKNLIFKIKIQKEIF